MKKISFITINLELFLIKIRLRKNSEKFRKKPQHRLLYNAKYTVHTNQPMNESTNQNSSFPPIQGRKKF